MNEELYKALILWEGWGKGQRERIYDNFKTQSNFLNDLVDLYEKEPVFRPQTAWLMREHLEYKNNISEQLFRRVLSKTKELDFWWPKASLLRVVTLGTRTKKMAIMAELFVRSCLTSEKIALQAYSYEAFGVLALHNNEYEKEARELCTKGMESGPAAVYVKSRKALKKLDR